MRTFILTKAYAMQLGNSKADDEKAKYLLNLVQEFDKQHQTKMIHELKILPEYFEAVFMGEKNFEIRKNDRDFKKGDTLILKEWDNKTEQYTGRELARTVTYVFEGGSFGLDKSFVIMAIQ